MAKKRATPTEDQDSPALLENLDEYEDDNLPTVRTSSAPKYTPFSKVFDLVSVKGLTYEEAGKALGISKQAVWEFCKNHEIPSKSTLARFKMQRADYLAQKQMQLINSLTPEDIKTKASPYQKVGMFGILFDKERLERGLANQHIAYKDISSNLDELEKEI